MLELTILLRTKKDAVELTRIFEKYPYDIDMVRGRDVIDARSILGVLGIGVGRKTRLYINAEKADALIGELEPYLISA